VTRGPVRPPDNPRRYQSQLNRELAFAGLAIALIVGGGLIYLIWGVGALIGAAFIFAVLVALVLVVALVLRLLDWAAKRE
jgi:hypothetical protein